MNLTAFFLATLLHMQQAQQSGATTTPMASQVSSNEHAAVYTEAKAIQTLLDSVAADGLNGKKFIALSYSPLRGMPPRTIKAYILAWFHYGPGDCRVEAGYFLLPETEPSSGLGDLDLWKRQNELIREIIAGEKTAGDGEVRRFAMPLPPGLRDDALFEKMRRIYIKRPPPQEGVSEEDIKRLGIRMDYSDGNHPVCYFGIKTAELEYIRDLTLYYGNFPLQRKIEDTILWPIAEAILRHETPEGWAGGSSRESTSAWPNGGHDR